MSVEVQFGDLQNTLNCVVGSGKQLDAKNVHYNVEVQFGDLQNWLVPILYRGTDGAQKAVEILDKGYSFNSVRSGDEYSSHFNLDVSNEYRDEDFQNGKWSLGLKVNDALRNDRYDEVELYKGSVKDVTDGKAERLGSLITEDKTYPLSNYSNFTIVLKKNGAVVGRESFYLNVGTQYTGLNDYYLRDAVGNSVTDISKYEWDEAHRFDIRIRTLYKEYPANGTYYQRFGFAKGGDENNDLVELAVVGYYATKAEAVAAKAADIKADLFSDKGYAGDYSGDGIIFSVFAEGEAYHMAVRTENGQNTKDSRNSYTHLNISGAKEFDYSTIYEVPSEHDSYFKNGYLTVLLMDEKTDLSALTPMFYADDKATVYAGSPAVAQESGKSVQDFSEGPVHYTVSAEDGENSGEYWVTFAQKTEGAKLFVNAVNGPDGAKRELFLNSYAGKTHDIFIANLGNEALTGLKVTLNATNVKLDDYWTTGGNGNDTLAAFNTVETPGYKEYGELPNVAKIRIHPDGNGAINGTLTISADGQEPVVITLSGVAGDPTITTTEIPTGVKYVPYGTMIQTTNMYDWNKLTFSKISGELPSGVTIKPNGEIYGVPQETGSFEFTVRMSNSYSRFRSVTATYTLVVEENTDENVDASTDAGYEIMTRVPVLTSYSDQVFEIKGGLPEFMDFWLDGKKMERDVDYSAEEGSTKITIFNQTFQQAGSGSHTIAAEFRVDGDVNKDMKKAAQNYTVNSGTKPTDPGTKPTNPGTKPTDPSNVKVGDIVNFTGTVHYTTAYDIKGYKCKPGQARVTRIYTAGGTHHYHLIAVSGGGSTVYGWVDGEYIAQMSTATTGK